MATQLTEKTLGGSLQNIDKLESTTGWVKFNREMRDYLTMNGFGDLFGRNKAMPERGSLTVTAYDAKKENWFDKQERACAAVRSRLGYNAREEVKGATVLENLFTGLQKRFRPTGSAVFQHLDRRYHELSLDGCSGISDFAEKLREARTELLELDSTCTIGEPHFVNKFLTGLGSNFDVFLTSFYQTHSLIPERHGENEITVKAVTFEEAVMAAEKEEQSLKIRDEKVAYLANGGRGGSGNGDAKEVPWCTHCRKAFHTRESCFALHPNLKKAHEEKRSERKQKRNSQKRNHDKKKEEVGGTSQDDAGDLESSPNAALAWQLPDDMQRVGFMAAQESAGPLKDVYVADTGCSQHSICRKEDFISLQPYTGKPLSGIGNTKLTPQGVGTAQLICNIGGKPVFMLLSNALFCPDMGVNLISITQLLRVGANVSFEPERAQITHGHKTFTATQRAGLFLLDL
jgi:hypothetical protein